ncbi:MAG: glycoside hydrolase [Christensenellales bacterium]
MRDEKSIKKFFRGIIQVQILLIIFCLLIFSLFTFKEYQPYESVSEPGKDNGFIALSYFAVDIHGSETTISEEQLEKHIGALKESGYVTITQQDVIDYVYQGKSLPEKALFLMFEDGRRDSAIFAQNILEDHNYIASMLSYANNLNTRDMRLLSGNDLKELENSTFWELGTNGYRLSYINVFDRSEHFLGELTIHEFAALSEYIDRDYNHYLMDYIRDEYDIPLESHAEMRSRVAFDYEAMVQAYEQYAHGLPQLYVLMHSNTGRYGTDEQLSEENKDWIEKQFALNFNREGNSLNIQSQDAGLNPYDLTRMQPQAYWSVNHLLMRIWDATGLPQPFEEGNADLAKDWDLICGASKFQKDRITITSLPRADGIIRLSSVDTLLDASLSVRLKGNIVGLQAVDLRENEDAGQCVSIEIKDNILSVYESVGGSTSALFSVDLSQVDAQSGNPPTLNTIDEILAKEIQIKNSQTYKSSDAGQIAKKLQSEKNSHTSASQTFPASAFDLQDAGDRLLEVSLNGTTLSISVDQIAVVEDLEVTADQPGGIRLRSGWRETAYSQRNLQDDVYDAVFENLLIKDVSHAETDQENIFYDGQLHGWDAFVRDVKRIWSDMTQWISHVF